MKNTCFFSGHRNLPQNKIGLLKSALTEQINSLLDIGVTHFIAGGALGFDTLCADTLIEMQSSSSSLADKIHLSLFLPCYDQTKHWSDEDIYHFNMIKFKAENYVYITKGPYTKNCMRLRNYAMVDNSSYGIVYCTNMRSGTGQTVRYANRNGISLFNLALTLQ